MSATKNETVRPLVLTVENKDGKPTKYTLEFNRDTVRRAERSGFVIESLGKTPMTSIPEFFYYAMLMHQPKVTRTEVEHILFDPNYGFGGISNIPEGVMERLGELYTVPFSTITDESKNCNVTVEL